MSNRNLRCVIIVHATNIQLEKVEITVILPPDVARPARSFRLQSRDRLHGQIMHQRTKFQQNSAM